MPMWPISRLSFINEHEMIGKKVAPSLPKKKKKLNYMSYDAGERIEISSSYNEHILYVQEVVTLKLVTTSWAHNSMFKVFRRTVKSFLFYRCLLYNLYKILPYSVRFIIFYCI